MEAKTLLTKILSFIIGFVFLSAIVSIPGIIAMEELSSFESFEGLVVEVAGQDAPSRPAIENIYNESAMPELNASMQASFLPSIILAIIAFALIAYLKRDDLAGIIGFPAFPLIFSGILLFLFPILLEPIALNSVAQMMPNAPPETVAQILHTTAFQQMYSTFNLFAIVFLVAGIILIIAQFFVKKIFPSKPAPKPKKKAAEKA